MLPLHGGLRMRRISSGMPPCALAAQHGAPHHRAVSRLLPHCAKAHGLQTQLSWLQLNNTLEELAEELQVNASDYVISFTRSLTPAQAARAWLAAAPFLLDPVQVAAHLGASCSSADYLRCSSLFHPVRGSQPIVKR